MKLDQIAHNSHHSKVILGVFLIGLCFSLIIPNVISTSVPANTDTNVNQPFSGLSVDVTINTNISGDLTINSLSSVPNTPLGLTLIGNSFTLTFVPDNSSEPLRINSANINITLTLELLANLGGVRFETTHIYQYNPTKNEWDALNTTLVNNSFVATITSLGYFAIFTQTLGINIDTIILVVIFVLFGVILSFIPSFIQSRRKEELVSSLGEKKKSTVGYK